jgi:phosphoribosylamine--glycine ligase / phosphoribosylformylglycinamidine cyclo-ligase
MKLLIIGGGGREHALVWKLSQSSKIEHIFVAPGNGGTPSAKSTNVPIHASAIPNLVQFATKNAIDLTIVGPEEPLALGVVNAFQQAELKIFGPNRTAARLESSKAFAKNFMRFYKIPTAEFNIFNLNQVKDAEKYVETLDRPVVVKAHGLAAGKGVLICENLAEAKKAITRILVDLEFGDAGKQIVIEEKLLGKEVSVLAFSDGKNLSLMPPVRDHKCIFDQDQGPNTGGMGAFTPLSDVNQVLLDTIRQKVLEPTLKGMAEQGSPYVGILYAGLMLTKEGPKVLEFNCRFGDPETQVIMPLLETDLVDIITACLEQKLDTLEILWKPQASITVVAASPGYPGDYPKGLAIQLPATEALIFHAGTQQANNQLITAGGRVLSVSSVGATLHDAKRSAYEILKNITFEGMHYRKDIGGSSSAYSASGVSIDASNEAVAQMKEAVQATYTSNVLAGLGAFGGMFDASFLHMMRSPVLVASTDGVGTKTKVASKLGRWDTIGQDLVNHCVNDILVQGAKPLFFLDYIASSKLEPEQISSIVKGMAVACKHLGFPLIGGETAEMPGVYEASEVDVAGTIIGVVERGLVIDSKGLNANDVILAFPSTGLHTNGFSLARKALEKLDWNKPHPKLGQSIGEALLAIHRPYLHQVEALWQAGVKIKALVHITGGGIVENVPRILPEHLDAVIQKGSWQIPPIFDLIQEQGAIETLEMYRVFNMGLGMLVMVSESDVIKARGVLPELEVVGNLVTGTKSVTLS